MVYCKICSTKTINDNELCKFCQKKRKAAHIILMLQDKITFKEKFNNSLLFNLGYEDKRRNQDIIWTLEDSSVIKETSRQEYKWIDIDLIKKFVEKYDENNGKDLKISNAAITENQKKCPYCGKAIPQYKKKQKLCEECKDTKKTLKNIKLIDPFNDSFNIDDIINKTSKEMYQVETALFNLVDNNLIKKIDEKNYQKIPEKIEEYLKEHEDIKNQMDKHKTDKKKLTKKSTAEDSTKKIIKVDTGNANEIKEKALKDIPAIDEDSKPTFVPRKENPNISIIQPAGWVLYKKNNRNNYNISEYKILKGVSNSKEYNSSRVYLLNDYENVKWIKDINKYYVYTKGCTVYENITLYTSDDFQNESKEKDSSSLNITNEESVKKEDNYLKDNNKQTSSNDKKFNKDVRQNADVIFDEFFNDTINISDDEKSWISYDVLLEVFNEYVSDKYKTNIPELGENGFNQLLYSKIKKTSGIKTKNANSTMEFNLIYNKDVKLNENRNDTSSDNIKTESVEKQVDNQKTEKSELSAITQVAKVNTLLSQYLNKNLKIEPREANTGDLTQKDIYDLFVKHLNEQNKTITYPLFAYSFQRVVNNEKDINKKSIDRRVYYNLTFNKQERSNTEESKNITKTTVTEKTTSKVENIKSNYEIFDEFFEKHLEITKDNQWIKKQRLHTLFNNYALNNYNVEISENGLYGFNWILQSRNMELNDIKKRIRYGQIEYNVKYFTSKKQENIDESRIYVTDYDYKSTEKNENKTDIEFKRFKEYSDNHIRILDNEVEEYDIIKDEIYYNYKEYYQEKYNEKLKYDKFESAFIKYVSEENEINTLLKDEVIHYNLEIVDNLEVYNNDVDEDISTDYKSNKKVFDDFWDNHIEVTDENKVKSIDKIYVSFKKYALDNYGLNIKEEGSYGFNRLFYLKKKEEKQLISKKIGRKVQYNIKYISNKNNDTKSQQVTAANSLNDNEHGEKPVEISQQKEILHKLRYYLNNNLFILKRKPSLEDLTDCDLFADFKRYLLEKHNEFITFHNFKVYLIKVLNNYPSIDFVTEDNQLHFNLEFIYEDKVNMVSQRRITNYENVISTDICQYLENKNINKLENENEFIMIYNEMIDYMEYKKLMSILNESIELIEQINVSSINEEKLNVNLILRIKKDNK